MNASPRPIRVAVIGGGCGALTAAFELTRPENNGKFDVTVYQMGWRLGGKGASGRGVANRVEEHGLHLWMGFYENAFRLMRDCYEERNRIHPNCRFVSWSDAFRPAPDVGVAECTPNGWSFWMAHFPPGQGEPGDPSNGDPYTPMAYVRQCVKLVGELLRSAGVGKPPPTPASAAPDAAAGSKPSEAEDLAARIGALLKYGQLATIAGIVEGSDLLRRAANLFLPDAFSACTSPVSQLIDALAISAGQQLSSLVGSDSELRRVWQVIDIILAVLRGSVRFGLAINPLGFDAINDYDWREWLRINGASEESLQSGFMRGIYDLVFAFEDGDVSRPRLAAGVALRGALRMFFTYRGSLFWRMSAGMGDVVFAPLYQVLKHRGVKFAFFHRLRNIGLSPQGDGDPPYVQKLEFEVQARVVTGQREYQPLVDIHNVPSWPAQPDFSQLINGEQLAREKCDFESGWESGRARPKTIRVGKDFDFVVLGASVATLPEVARELIERQPRWREMVRHVKTVATQTFQIWIKESTAAIGWPHPPANLSGFVDPFDTWAEMSHLIPEEDWTEPVRSLAYFCSVLPDTCPEGAPTSGAFYHEQQERVRMNAVRFMENHVGALWPKAVRDRGFRWEILACEGEANHSQGKDRFNSQYWRANVSPSDRYVQSLPGTIRYRISPLEADFDNLTVAGDWTATGLDSGCIESAVISGRLAAHALSGKPALREIVGYDHP